MKKEKARAQRIVRKLTQSRPKAVVELDYHTPFELLVATILSAQCTDERVNKVTPRLFQEYPGPEQLAKAKKSELETIIYSTGFFKSKARHLIACSRCLIDQYQGVVPEKLEDLTILPGIGRKTANVIVGGWFGKPAVVVDTHVKRVANRLKLTKSSDPTKIEQDLQQLLPRSQWTGGSQRLFLHGRYVCLARSPKCDRCVLYEDCHWERKRFQ